MNIRESELPGIGYKFEVITKNNEKMVIMKNRQKSIFLNGREGLAMYRSGQGLFLPHAKC